ncbi:MAG: sensor histidine kinase [Gammaproteobacteria bacterium]|nr:sensor histidine kinase [Gammaproteobacteria bacterium]
MTSLSRLYLLVFLLAFSTSLFASPLHLGADIAYTYYEDKNGALSFEEFLDIPEEKLTESHRILSKGYTNSVFWVKAEINGEGFKDKDYWLEILPTYLDDVEIYYKSIDYSGNWEKRVAGDFNKDSAWDFDYRSPVYILPPSSKGYSFIFRIKTSSSMIFNVKIWGERDFSENELKRNMFWFFIFGVFSFTAIAFLILAIISRKRDVLVCFLSATIYLNVFFVQGYFGWVFSSSYFYLQNYFVSFFSISAYGIVLLMCATLLGRPPENKKINIFIDFVFFAIFFQNIFLFFDMYLFAMKNVCFLFAIGSATVLYLCFFDSRKRTKNMKDIFIFFGVVSLISIVLFRMLTLNGFIYYPEGEGYFWQIVVAMITFFMMGVTISNLYKENIRDIERRNLIRELNIEREARFHQKQFVSMVSHEFRTSLAIISGAITNILNFYDYDESLEKRYKRIERANKRLVQLTDNCLADDRLSSDVQTFQLKKQNLTKIILDACEVIYMSDHHSIQFSLNHEPIECLQFFELPINADSAMLQIAFSNIFDNALKYMEEGVLEVDIYNEKGFYFVDVLDHGIGIDKEKESEIFDRYKKLTQVSAGEKSGVGLGLYICKTILLGHGGDVYLLKNSECGCCFQFKIPKISID